MKSVLLVSLTILFAINLGLSNTPILVGVPDSQFILNGIVFENVPADVTVECDEVPNTPNITATSNCASEVTVTSTETTGTSDCPYIITRCWTATDECGNSADTCQVITVHDITPPVIINMPLDTMLECGMSIDPLDFSQITATDNCDTDVNITFEEIHTGNACDTILRIITATDNCGHMTIDTQIITFTPMLLIFQPQSTWTYGYEDNYGGQSWSGYEVWEYMGDVTIEDVLLKEVRRTQYQQYEEGITTEEALDNIYFRVDGQQIYYTSDIHRNEGDYTTLIYDFDVAIGDYITVTEDIRMKVLSEEVAINNGQYSFDYIGQIECKDGDAWTIQSGELEYSSRVGGMNNLNMFRHACSSESNRVYTLRCYSDQDLSVNYEDDCGFVEGIVSNDNLTIDGFKVYPNPVGDDLSVDLIEKGSYSIVDLEGKVILGGLLDSESNKIDVSSLTQGVYYLEVSQGKRKTVEKLIKM